MEILNKYVKYFHYQFFGAIKNKTCYTYFYVNKMVKY